MKHMSKTVWILADDRAGNVNQLLGIAEALKWPFERKDIRYNAWIRLPNVVRGASLIGLDTVSKNQLQAPWPDVVLSAGRRSFPIARYIKKQSRERTKIVQLMNPGPTQMRYADIIVLPEHDRYRGHNPHIMTIAGTPNRVTPDMLAQARLKWRNILSGPQPIVSVIVGGATKNKPFTLEMADLLVRRITALNPGTVCVTTSRRTPPDVVSFLKKRLPKIGFFYVFGDSAENPYFGLLACADMLVVTGDSMSMCSECCATGKPVYLFAPDEMMSDKHKRFHQTLYRAGYALDLETTELSVFQGTVFLNPAVQIADRIRSLF